MKKSKRTVLRGFAWSVWIGAALASCGGDERDKLADVTKPCFLPSDCLPGLICLFQTCHVMCEQDVDCKERGDGARCVRALGFNACQEPDERSCKSDWDCWGGQTCAVDGKCHDACSPDHACVSGLQCSAGGECARRSELGPGDVLLPAPDAGTGGTPGDAGSPGMGLGGDASGGTSGLPSSGGTTTSGGATSGPELTGGAGGEPGDVGSGGKAQAQGGHTGRGGAMSYAGAPMDEGQVEEEPNDDAKSANGVQPGIITGELTGKEQDYFTISTPEGSPAGGYFEFRITDIPPTERIRIDVYSAFDAGQIYYDGSENSGQSVLGFFVAAPEQTYGILISHLASNSTAESNYKLDLRYERFVDVYEPNNDQATAADIELGVPVSAFMTAGLRAASVEAADYSDWYGFQAATGGLNVLIDNVPKNVELVAQVFNAAGGTVGGVQRGGNAGADVMFSRTLPADDRYFLHVTYRSVAPATDGRLSVDGPPAHVVQPYTLLVSQ